MRSPTFLETTLITSPTNINGINTAIIDVGCSQHPGGGVFYEQLMACAYNGSGGGNPGGVSVKNLVSGLQINIPYPVLGASMAYCPDVILGNNTQIAGNSDYVMAVAFIDNFGSADVDFYDIHVPSPGLFTCTFHSRLTIPSPGWNPYKTIHIDGVADHKAFTTGDCPMPICDRFFVTYDAFFSGGSVEDVLVAYGSLSTYSLITGPVLFAGGIHTTDNANPDVAGVQKNWGTVKDIAILTWTTQGWYPGGMQLFQAYWDPATGAVTTIAPSGFPLPPPPLYTPYNEYNSPRIDANDDYTTNSSTNSNFKIVTQTYHYPGPFINKAYDDFTPMGTGWNVPISNWMGGAGMIGVLGANFYMPAVAYGPNNSQYVVSQVLEDIASNSAYMMLEPIDQTNPLSLATDPSSTLSYFLVNGSSTIPVPINSAVCNYTNSVSTPCNNVSDMSVVAWAVQNAGGSFDINYKTTTYDPTGTVHPFGYQYKQEHGHAPATFSAVKIWPNPASKYISIGNPKEGADRYTISNLLGQVMATCSLSGGEQKISVEGWAAGSYVITLYKNGETYGHHIFVKN